MDSKESSSALRTSIFSIASHVVLAIIKALAGFLGMSYALIADAIESAVDALSSILVMIGLNYAQKPADENHPYGHGRAEPLITMIVVGTLAISAGIISYESIQHIMTPHKVPKSWTLIVLLGVIAWKEISFRIVLRKSKLLNSSALEADAWHHRSDAITSVTAFIGVLTAVVMGKGYETADDWAALLASAFILYNAYKIFRPALAEIMDEHIHDELIQDIRMVSVKVEGIVGTEKCFVRKVGMNYHIDLHALVDGSISVKEGHDLAHQLKDQLVSDLPLIGQVLIHIEPVDLSM
ncbi:cation diffusion facilitator family transporter [Reichenbachiella ulvae]|uniref:Cation diffusion facilitator family transporter n=1 Tax=Reichenbachiella ulvae TaxID=2980104 RepID=A0ABT3CPI6_9BACT|nr:cation diffusion facilitator family transporter [Reichenbachiella ulvae]MCV9385640.1 cation diffusion facilitator family transporter [Reichenbachiella ulvae]